VPPFHNPTVLIARPKEPAEQFSHALSDVAGPFQALISPAFELVAVQPVKTDFDVAIFTSRAGVLFAPKGNGRVAYCVGDATAQTATNAGYIAISAAGSASDLTALILAQAPQDRLVHVRGETSVGNVNATLQGGGLNSAEIVAYRKNSIAPDRAMLDKIKEAKVLVIPLFSAETVSILMDWPVGFEAAHVIAMSDAVATQARDLDPASVTLSDNPDLPSMVAATARLIA
jgi:uroporphyrinogen-III synthase